MEAPLTAELMTGPARLPSRFRDVQRVVFDLDGTLYDTRDFERPALAAVADWLRCRSGQPLEGLTQALWKRREAARHKLGLFDNTLIEYGLPPGWGAECARRFRDYPGGELAKSPALRDELQQLRSRSCRLALVTNGRAQLQSRKLAMLGLTEIFDIFVYCDPELPHQLKPSVWAWAQLTHWRAGLPAAYVGDEPVDAEFAREGQVAFVPFAFRNPVYGD